MSAELQELLGALEKSITTDKAEAVARVYELRFAGVEGSWYLDLTKSANYLGTERPDGDICRLGMHVEDLSDLLENKAKLSQLFSVGRLRVFQNMADAMKLEALFENRS